MHPITRFFTFVGLTILVSALIGCSDCNETGGLIDAGEGQSDADADTVSTENQGVSDVENMTNGDADNLDPGPECAAELECGDQCCDTDELCLPDGCTLPGDDCAHQLECPEGQFCETTLGKCLPGSAGECTYQPDDDAFDPVVEVAWEGGPDTPMPEHNQVMMAPSVVDITEDGIPEIVFSTFQGGDYDNDSILRAVNGRSFEPVFDLVDPDMRVSGSSSVAIGDIDGDGRNEIVAVAPSDQGSGLIVFDDHTTGWEVMWRSDSFGMSWDGAYLADLDANGSVEVVANNRVYDGASGTLLCVNDEVGTAPRNSLVADLNGNGNLDVVASAGAFEFIRHPDGTVECPTMWTYGDNFRGFPAAGDFGTFSGDDHQFGTFNGLPEIATVNYDDIEYIIRLHNGQTGELIWEASMPVDGHSVYDAAECQGRTGAGPPTIADFNGDGRLNIATAGACFYVVLEDNGQLLWSMAIQDFSSRVTGSSVFDFQGNGRAEVVYADECFLRVYDGTGNDDGSTEILFEVANTTGTTRELPVIVDVNRDYHADIVLIGNDYAGGITDRCREHWAGFDELGGPSRGIRVVRDAENRWVPTRPVWNQHAYSVTNVCDGLDDSLCPGVDNRPGAIPSGRIDNWSVGHLNNFRQNVQGEGLFHAPDLVITHLSGSCSVDGFTIEATVANQGSRAVIEGLNVALFALVDGEETLVAVVQTTQPLAPGASETLTYQWDDAPFEVGTGEQVEIIARANDDGTGQRQYRECDETNNERTSTVLCPCTEDDDCDMGYYCNPEGLCLPIEG